jgi:hypothetical protein
MGASASAKLPKPNCAVVSVKPVPANLEQLLLAAPEFLDALPGYLLPDAASQARISTVLGRLEALTLV